MYTFTGIKYLRPDYKKAQEVLLGYVRDIKAASSYEEIRQLWISMRESMQYIDYLEEYAYVCFLCGMSYEFYAEEVRIQNIEYPQLEAMQKECDTALLNSPYISEFELEFGHKIVNQLKNNIVLKGIDTIYLQSEESRLKTKYTALLSSRQKNDDISDEAYDILDKLIKVRSEIAKALGFKNYIEMGYRLHERFDYGPNEISTFRIKIKQIITPACAELRKSEVVNYPKTYASDANDLITVIKNMYCDISKESEEYINHILDHEMLDIADRPNKRPNYYACCMIPYLKTPFIIGCFHGGGMEANYLIHELAHGFAFYSAARSQKLYEYHRAVTSINEIHSKTMEYLAYPYLDSLFGSETDAYVHNHLFHDFVNLPYRCAIDEFEHTVYDDLTLKRRQRCELWAEIRHKYMPWKASDTEAIKRGSYWPNQAHLFTHPFYYIEYDIAQISVFEFFTRSKDNYKQTWNEYSRLCRAGGSLNYLKLLDVGNLTSPFSENAVESICNPIINELFAFK
jgi:M3 family oligoendopeptidase